MNALSKGLSYAPTTHASHFQTKVDLYKFFRNLHLKAWYHNRPAITCERTPPVEETREPQPFSPFRPKSTFFPFSNNVYLNAYIKKVNHDVEKLFQDNKVTTYSNLTPREKHVVKWLKNNEEIVVRSADKGGATVIWGKPQYVDEAQSSILCPSLFQPH